MNDRDLATGLRDLFGWHIGMVLKPAGIVGIGGVVVHVGGGIVTVCPLDSRSYRAELYAWGTDSRHALPDTEHWSNIGRWLGMLEPLLPGMRLGRDDMAANWEAKQFQASHHGTPAVALLGLYCKVYGDLLPDGVQDPRPASVRSWWASRKDPQP